MTLTGAGPARSRKCYPQRLPARPADDPSWRPSQTWGGIGLRPIRPTGEWGEMARHDGVDRERRRRPLARNEHGRQQHKRMLGWDARSDAGGRETDTRVVAGPRCSGTSGGPIRGRCCLTDGACIARHQALRSPCRKGARAGAPLRALTHANGDAERWDRRRDDEVASC